MLPMLRWEPVIHLTQAEMCYSANNLSMTMLLWVHHHKQCCSKAADP